MKQGQLIPRHRRKRQPTADTMREQLRLAADEIIRLRAVAPGKDTPPPPPTPPPCRIVHRGLFASFTGPEDEFERWKAMPLWRRMFRGRP